MQNRPQRPLKCFAPGSGPKLALVPHEPQRVGLNLRVATFYYPEIATSKISQR